MSLLSVTLLPLLLLLLLLSSINCIESVDMRDDICFDQYARKLREANDDKLNAIAWDRAPALPSIDPDVLKELRSKPLIIAPGPGTTATHGLVRMLTVSPHYNLTALHWDECFSHAGRCVVRSMQPCKAQQCTVRNGRMAFEKLTSRFRVHEKPVEVTDWIQQTRNLFEDVEFLRALTSFDVLSDTPIGQYIYFLFKLFPNASVIYTDRRPSEWAPRRAVTHSKTPCEALFAHRHEDYLSSTIDLHSAEVTYNATRSFIKCLVPEHQLLVVNLFEQEPRQVATAVHRFVARSFPHIYSAPPLTDVELKLTASQRSGAHSKKGSKRSLSVLKRRNLRPSLMQHLDRSKHRR